MQQKISTAAHYLREGKLVAFPTETVYGLGGNAFLDQAVARIYALKARPQFNPLIVHTASFEQAEQLAEFSELARTLAQKFWPGPLTLVLPRRADSGLSLLLSAGLDSVALRMPAHPIAQALLHETGVPLAAPSANRSGRISPTQAMHVYEEFGNCNEEGVSAILDGGNCTVGIESTVIAIKEERAMLLRPGSITETMLIPITAALLPVNSTQIAAPGMLTSHYAPRKPVRLNATSVSAEEALLAFGPALHGAYCTESLSTTGNPEEAAANLFRMLRILDASNARQIAVMPVPHEGLGIAINDRLMRAAAPKD